MANGGVACQKCGHRNQPGARFCSSCGVTLADPARNDTVAIEAIDAGDEFALDRSQFPASIGLLIVTRGPNVGARYALDAPALTIGRHPDSEIFLDDVTVSRRHAVLEHAPGGAAYVIRDESSLNGTYVNRARIDSAPLEDGDEVQVGAFKLMFFHGTKS